MRDSQRARDVPSLPSVPQTPPSPQADKSLYLLRPRARVCPRRYPLSTKTLIVAVVLVVSAEAVDNTHWSIAPSSVAATVSE